MESEVHASLDCQECQPIENNLPDCGGSPATQSCGQNVLQQPAKRPTRRWAAWTREEEESFFTALRQVGKDFEKITCRVQSKNKDQVRHYYYRLVRRMNKLLGPRFSLNAKDSKDTNAAMLRWWSLLEKYSCKASKLHLKPRRFKIFIEALEHQLLKDRKKNVRKRSSQGENCPSTSQSAYQNKLSGNDARAVKLVLVDTQNIQKVSQGKGLPVRRNTNVGAIRGNTKRDSSTAKAGKQSRKPGAASLAAMKRWEEAAIAGMSLVADAAEHLERSAGEKEAGQQEQNGLIPSEQMQCQLNLAAGSNSVQSAVKLKLQLFPIDDATRRALEMDKHNPFLELTLSTRKKITSVLEHLNRKWGSSNVACGELMLFPYSVHRENIMGCQRWTSDSPVSAAEIYSMIGYPPVFRLRYGWILRTEFHPATSQAPSGLPDTCSILPINKAQPSATHNTTVLQSVTEASNDARGAVSAKPETIGLHPSSSVADMSWQKGQIAQRPGNSAQISTGEWADSLTNVSVSDLLADAPCDNDVNCAASPVLRQSRGHEETVFTCDSFDAAIAAHMYRHQNKSGLQSGVASNLSSIWDAEETCDAFTFPKRSIPSGAEVPSAVAGSVGCEETARTSPTCSEHFDEDLTEAEETAGAADEDDLMDECPSDEPHEKNSDNDLNPMPDIYWPDSLDPLDLDAPPCRYSSQDLILTDSLGGLSRLIASSLDAFQNCSFFDIDQKEAKGSEVKAQRTGLFSDDKPGTGVDGV